MRPCTSAILRFVLLAVVGLAGCREHSSPAQGEIPVVMPTPSAPTTPETPPPPSAPAPEPVTLTVTRTGVGSISSKPAGLDCGSNCRAAFTPGSNVTLIAAATADTRFTGYSGDCTGMSCTLTMDVAKSVTATFIALPPPITVSETATSITATDGTASFTIPKASARYSVSRGGITVQAADPTLPDPATNPDYTTCDNISNGIDRCYPGLEDVSYRPLAYRTAAGWQRATGSAVASVGRRTLHLALSTSDGEGAMLDVSFPEDAAIEFVYAPKASGILAVADAVAAVAGEGYFGAGQRFTRFNLTGLAVPLWISHGLLADRYTSTNEIAVPFFWSPRGWGLWSAQDERGELNFANPTERVDAVHVLREASVLKQVFYFGTPQQILATHTARSGRPKWTPADWMWRPMIWQDEDTSTDSVMALINGMKSRAIPLGAVWLDNPWDAGRASFDFASDRFAEPDRLIADVHAAGVKLMVWLSPYVGGEARTFAESQGWVITGVRADNNDATYLPARSLDAHLDFTNPAAFAWYRDGLRRLVRRGVDGVKLDRCEEDLSDTSVWANGLPNAANHNPYCTLYQQASYEAFALERPPVNGVSDFALMARGGWTGASQFTGHWAGDNISVSGELGLAQALRSLLSLSASGFPWNAADMGGYVGLRQDMGEAAFGNPLLPPTPNTYIRWVQLGALSPVMQGAIPPWWVSDEAIAIYRTYATLHDRLAPYTDALARESIASGTPIVRPMAFAYPTDTVAAVLEDQYLYGPDLLVAPIIGEALEAGTVARTVYLPSGDRWVDFWSGMEHPGGLTIPVVVPLAQLPIFVRKGAMLPQGVSAAELP